MTKVMPMAITAMIEDCTRMLVRLSGDRKRLVSSAVTTHSTTSVISGIWPTQVEALAHASAADGGAAAAFVEARLRARCAPRSGRGATPARVSHRRVSSARSLGGDQHAAAALAKSPDQRMDLRLGGDVDALRRLVEQQHADLAAPAIWRG